MFKMRVFILISAFLGIVVDNTIGTTPDGKIVGGRLANQASFPYLVSLQYFGMHSCGASLISPEWVLTAAHCLEGTITNFLTVRAGSKTSTVIPVKNKYTHKQYTSSTIDYDIGLVELSSPIDPEYAEPLSLPRDGAPLIDGQLGTIAGWGATTEKGAMSYQLRVTQVPVINHGLCKRILGQMITDRMFCAGFVKGGKDACQGDSGGPFVVNGVQLGVISWGFGCAQPQKPGVYTNVAVLRRFIKNVSGI